MTQQQSQAAAEPFMKPVRSILVSQPEPQKVNSPYFNLAKKFDLKVDFRSFIQVDAVPEKEFRKQKITILDHTAIIFTSKNAIDHFFRIVKAQKLEVPAEMKYFCVTEHTANYLQKYITVRKRKVFIGQKTAKDLIELFKKHKKETFLFPCSDIRKNEIPDFLAQNDYTYNEAVIYRTVSSDLSDLKDIKYDVIAFFSPSGIKSLYDNFPDFEQGETRIAAFGPTTAKAVRDHNLRLDIEAPHPNAPSMTGAIELYIKEVNGLLKK